jgi:hypothetical protein
MNRHERRQAAAIVHKRIPGYQHRLFSAYANWLLKRGGFYHAVSSMIRGASKLPHDPNYIR